MNNKRKPYMPPEVEVNDFISRNGLMVPIYEGSTTEMLGKENNWEEEDLEDRINLWEE